MTYTLEQIEADFQRLTQRDDSDNGRFLMVSRKERDLADFARIALPEMVARVRELEEGWHKFISEEAELEAENAALRADNVVVLNLIRKIDNNGCNEYGKCRYCGAVEQVFDDGSTMQKHEQWCPKVIINNTSFPFPHPGAPLLKELEGLRKVAEIAQFHWTPMKEKTPQEGGNYLCWYQDGFGNKGPWVGYWDDSREDFYPKWPNNPSRAIKYWSNLPEPPKAGETHATTL